MWDTSDTPYSCLAFEIPWTIEVSASPIVWVAVMWVTFVVAFERTWLDDEGHARELDDGGPWSRPARGPRYPNPAGGHQQEAEDSPARPGAPIVAKRYMLTCGFIMESRLQNSGGLGAGRQS